MATKNEYEIKWGLEDWQKIANSTFLPLVHNEDRFLILYGGRGSGKSRFVAQKLIYRILSESFFRCVLIRNVYQTIKDSSFQELVTVISDLGLNELFDITYSPLEIKCKNGNKILCRGLDNPAGIKSISDICCAWYEEEIVNEDAFNIVSSGIRTTKAKYIQEIFSINPETEGDYHDNWFYKQFFKPHEPKKTFNSKTSMKVGKKIIELGYTVHHSTSKDNKWVTAQYQMRLDAYKISEPYRYTVWTLGEWGTKEAKGLYYKNFNRIKSVESGVLYNSERPLHISWDFNRNPYVTLTIWQLIGNDLCCIDEIAGETPNNTTAAVCRLFKDRYADHGNLLYIYGDVNGNNTSTATEEGHNDYKVILSELQSYRPQKRVPTRNPSLERRGDFINSLFLVGYKEHTIRIADKCVHLIADLSNVKENIEGGKLKEKTTKDGRSYEPWGHMSDSMDYVICELWKNFYDEYFNGMAKPDYIIGKQPKNERIRF
jgi:hypothetical protein